MNVQTKLVFVPEKTIHLKYEMYVRYEKEKNKNNKQLKNKIKRRLKNMKNYFKYDFIKKEIVGSNAAIKRANMGIGKEYRELCKMLEEHPDFRVVAKDIAVKENKKKYTGLSFKRMKEYIATRPDAESALIVFEKVVEVAEAKGAKYPLAKKWFLQQYPEYKENEATVIELDAVRQLRAAADNEEVDKLAI